MSQAVISESNLTPLIQIITWFMLVTAVFAILLRAVSKTLIVRSLSVDDVLVLIAFVSVGATLSLYFLCDPEANLLTCQRHLQRRSPPPF